MKTEPEKLDETSKDAPSESEAHTSTAVDLEKAEHKEQVPIELPVKKPSSKKKWTIVVAVVLIVAALGAGGFFLTTKKAEQEKAAEASKAAAPTRFESSNKLVSSIKPALRGATVDVAVYDGLGGHTTDGFGAYGVAPYKVGDRKYSNYPGDSSGISYKGSSVVAEKNYEKISDFFKKNKFKTLTSGKDSYGLNEWFQDDLRYVSYATYESDDIVCMTWHVDASTTVIKDHVTSVGCADKSSYEDAAKSLDQFFAAYTKGESSPAEKIVMGVPSATDGADNYENVVMLMEDPSELDTQFEGLYYRKKDTKEWTYFTGSYGPLECSEYNSDTLKKAFKGFNCYDSQAQAYKTVG